ncbi:hypothetical protein ILUMI_14623, partial [Ignelater luminosus]
MNDVIKAVEKSIRKLHIGYNKLEAIGLSECALANDFTKEAENKHKQEVNNQKLEQVDAYKYLGAVIEREGNMEKEVNEGISKASRIYHSLNKAFIEKNCKNLA